MRTFINGPEIEPSEQVWEAAYLRFEMPLEEVQKFVQRLSQAGADAWPRDARIAELFCGRGSGLLALAELGFSDLEGIDLSPRLASAYTGAGSVRVGDCRALPWADDSKDVLIVQGGLHHLSELAQDLPRVFSEARRVLRVGGRFVAIEPWLTPFLQAVHWLSFSPLRGLSRKLDAFATMVEHERRTYENWLRAPELVLTNFKQHFQVEQLSTGWGKVRFVGMKAAS
jgi:SAM-dependent methyltransferase